MGEDPAASFEFFLEGFGCSAAGLVGEDCCGGEGGAAFVLWTVEGGEGADVLRCWGCEDSDGGEGEGESG